MNNNIPCFLHIPRSGGTYLLYKSSEFLRLYGLKNNWKSKPNWNLDIRLVFVTFSGKTIFTAIVYDDLQSYKTNKNFQPIYGPYSDIIEYKYFLEACKEEKLLISSIAIESDGAHLISSNFFTNFLNSIGLKPIYYSTLREPYDRAISLYSYINSPSSNHEPTHNLIKSKSIYDYLSSYELEDSWLIRVLTQIPDNQEINEEIFQNACKILDRFIIMDISKIDELIHEVFSKKYSDAKEILNELKSKTNFYKNRSENEKRPEFSDLDFGIKQFFLNRKKYDIRLYNRYTGNK